MPCGEGPVSPKPGRSKRITRRLSFSASTQPSHACREEPVPCSSRIGFASSRGPSSRKCTLIPATSTKVDGGRAQRPCKSATARSGAQLAATKPPIRSTGKARTPAVMIAAVTMVRGLCLVRGELSGRSVCAGRFALQGGVLPCARQTFGGKVENRESRTLERFTKWLSQTLRRHARTCSGHPRLSCRKQDVDGRDEPGHDVEGWST